MSTIIVLTVYFISVILSFYANKILYKSSPEKYNVLPALWVIPIVNTIAIFVLFFLFLKTGNNGDISSKFWEDKWS